MFRQWANNQDPLIFFTRLINADALAEDARCFDYGASIKQERGVVLLQAAPLNQQSVLESDTVRATVTQSNGSNILQPIPKTGDEAD
ncbi:hypothetical protein EHI45_26920 [Rhizobium leguminosarum]|uniref:hypothetical protein n=1 Tax=Rhizobium leguminosarum TaxID=384 RepID=UPI000FEC21DA|nr:hypothetical protein [Rhizobium leguminosarum]RWX06697.1 hypothetical protein EHI45_26920 [Rhizobium leguminosarum]